MSHADSEIPVPGGAPVPPPDAQAWYRALFDEHPAPLMLYDPATLRILAVNEAAVRQYGYDREELLAMGINELRPAEDVPVLLAQLATSPADGVRRGVFRHRRRDGSLFHARITSRPVDLPGRAARLTMVEDVSEREELEQRLRQAQKLDAVGRLAGGIAHDFNNLLTTILATYELMARAIPGESELREDLETIRGAASRGASLTSKLLALSRRRPLAFRALDVDALVGEFTGLLDRLVPAGVALDLRPGAGGLTARADPGAVEQVVLNLVTNACDAMPGGGTLRIATTGVELDEAYCRDRPGATPGPYVALAVSDSGGGMDEATLRRLFEPFFTTKAVGAGSGLGMAMVYGLVQQHGGYLDVASRPGVGTTVTVYLPRAAAAPPASVPASAPPTEAPPGGAGEVVLLVEDEPALRRAAARVLTGSGYVVLPAADGREALELVDRGERIDLVLTDMVMPHLGGSALVRALRERDRRVPVLVTTGHPGRAGEAPEEVPPGAHFLPKPWTITELLAAVRRALAAPAAGPATEPEA